MNIPVQGLDASLRKESQSQFDYDAAFSRNVGWVTDWEQQELRKKTVAIAGMGGVGGAHALTLARLGIGGLHLADFDRFDIVNMNRQAGAFASTVGHEKAAVMASMTRDINPDLRQKVFGEGIHPENLDGFLDGVDLFVDGLDFFALGIRRQVFCRCDERRIPAITAAPIGFGAAYLIFMPGGMTFEEYFRLEGLAEEKQYVNFTLGLTPKGFHRPYLVDSSRLDLPGKRGPSTAAAIQLCSGIVGAEAVKILLGRGKVYPAPAYHQFDAYRGRWARGYLRFGNAGPLQSAKRHIGYRAFAAMSKNARPQEKPVTGSAIERILDLARWAPSGDNAQPWGFRIVGEDQVIVTITRRSDDIYDYKGGEPTLLATGMLLETMRIAASGFGRVAAWRFLGGDRNVYQIAVSFPRRHDVLPDPLLAYIPIRSVDRRSYRRRPLTARQKDELEQALGKDLRIDWQESVGQCWRAARLNAAATDIRLRLRAAYEVHRRIIDWRSTFSRDGVPAAAIGLDRLTLWLMRLVMASWARVKLMNALPGGTLIPQLELDLLPGVMCAAHFVIQHRTTPPPDDHIGSSIRAGESLQRFWLTATALGLSLQPGFAPLVFGFYALRDFLPSGSTRIHRKARDLATSLIERSACDPATVLFRGRVGWPRKALARARSIRELLDTLVTCGQAAVYESVATRSHVNHSPRPRDGESG
jgi:sulfur-carrier protein adenylyltransferase/sulfurtransferase